jgi:hypothetical protein
VDEKVGGCRYLGDRKSRREGTVMTTQTNADAAADVDELTPQQTRDLLEREAQRLLSMSADDFATKWRAGEFKANDDPKVTQVAMLLPDAWT